MTTNTALEDARLELVMVLSSSQMAGTVISCCDQLARTVIICFSRFEFQPNKTSLFGGIINANSQIIYEKLVMFRVQYIDPISLMGFE